MKSSPIQQSRFPRRAASEVMRLQRLGSFHQSRLSFMRVLTRRMQQEKWTFERSVFSINENGVGHAVYCARGPNRTYSLVAFAHDLPDELRSDRVIAEQWDATYALFDGIPTKEDIKRLSGNVPLQEGGRVSESELTLSRSNKSARLWEHVVSSLASGVQPNKEQLDATGYLMRTTAVYGSGKFGAADHQVIASREECSAPFQAEMLTVYLIRAFVVDLVEHMAFVRGGSKAVKLDKALARSLGIGNSTGLGMAPFIINHPVLFNNWITAREEALAQVRSLTSCSSEESMLFMSLTTRSINSINCWHTAHELQRTRVAALQSDLNKFAAHLADFNFNTDFPWNSLYEWCVANLGVEAQECVVSLLLEPHGHLIDGFSHCMSSDSPALESINGAYLLSDLKQDIQSLYSWAQTIQWDSKEATARAWYVSEEKLEPRLGERFDEPIANYEQPLSPARDAALLLKALEPWHSETVAEFLLKHPEHRHTVRRIQTIRDLPYGEIHDNTISADLMPIDMLRCKLSFFGAIHFDPRSDRWVRIRMFANAPLPDELLTSDADLWPYPE